MKEAAADAERQKQKELEKQRSTCVHFYMVFMSNPLIFSAQETTGT